MVVVAALLGGASLAAAPSANDDIVVEFYLSRAHKTDRETIKREFSTVSVTRVRANLFPSPATPPTNIAIGREIPADVARLVIRLAQTYNGGITLLLPEQRVGHRYIAVGTMMFDEIVQVPVAPADVKRLADPGLSTPQFHALYRELTGEGDLP
jgi:hypothetical protein